MKFVVRVATLNDVPVLCGVRRRASLSNEGDRALLAEHPEFLEWSDAPVRSGQTRVAEVDGRIVGFVSAHDEDGRTELDDLFVEPEWMRRGIGRSLVDDVVATARRAGRSRIEVDANAHALAFYDRMGFVADGEVALEHGTAVHMHLDLPTA